MKALHVAADAHFFTGDNGVGFTYNVTEPELTLSYIIMLMIIIMMMMIMKIVMIMMIITIITILILSLT